jgi:flagellar assembly protein FliH
VRPPVFAELTQRQAPPAPVREPARAGGPLEAVREGHRIAHAIIARAEAQAQEIVAAAREQGLEAGRRQALEQGGAELRAVAGALAAAVAKLEETRAQLREELAATLPAAAVAIAGCVLRRELQAQPDALAHVLREAVLAVLPAARVEIRLHPDDLASLERHRDPLAETLAGVDVRLEPSASVGRGGCFVETDALTLAAGIPQQLERALALLTGDDA